MRHILYLSIVIERLENRPDQTETQETIPRLHPREAEEGSYMLLYELGADRAELNDLFEDDKARARRLRSLAEQEIESVYMQELDWFSTQHIFEFGTKSGGLGTDAKRLAELGYGELEGH